MVYIWIKIQLKRCRVLSGDGVRPHLPSTVGAEDHPAVRNTAGTSRHDGVGTKWRRKDEVHQHTDEVDVGLWSTTQVSVHKLLLLSFRRQKCGLRLR